MLHYRNEILQCEPDFGTIHSFVAHLIDKFQVPFDDVILKADELFNKIPPAKLIKYSNNSLLNQFKLKK